MSNKYWNRDTAPSKQSGGEGGSNKAMGSGIPMGIPEKTASWPGLPGGAQGKDRSGGTKKQGALGPFRVKSEGL